MRFSLIPREMQFFDLFDQVAVRLTEAADKFLDMLTAFDNLPARGRDLKAVEDGFDGLIGEIIQALDRSFITPFDREDIHTLATMLDDVIDNMEETAHRFEVFRLDRPTATAIDLAKIAKECCVHLGGALRLLRDLRQSQAINDHLREIGRLENEADVIYRDADAALFASANGDILTLIKWRELYAWLEETVDACKDVSRVISEIVIKGT